tara:strand:+ start:47 stop:772 length:726 start_codon:yes stop_codon:yes gene_type:complete
MSRTNWVYIVTLLILLNVPRLASGETDPWFAALIVSAGRASIYDSTDHDTIGTGAVIVNIVDGRLKEDEFDDTVAAVGLKLGRQIGNWDLHLESLWRYRTDWNLTAPTPSIRTVTNVFSNVETTSVLVNVARSRPISRQWSWQFGAGIGVVRNELESQYIEREEPGISPERVFKDDRSGIDFSWNLLAGLTRNFNSPWAFNIQYRFIDLGELTAGPYASRDARVSGKHHSHEVMLSMQRNF